jgi:hypothetical protein
MKKNSIWTLVAATGSVGTLLMACDTLSKVNRALDDFHKLANNANGAITDAREAAANASPSFSPSTGGTAWNERGGENAPKHANEPGKSGQIQEDMDGDGTAETVDVFVPDSDPNATYMSWSQGGVCYLYANEGGAEHLVQWECSDESTYYGCNLTENVCEVCSNTCTTCPSDFTDWAECTDNGQQGTGGEGYGGQSYGGQSYGGQGYGGAGGFSSGGFGGSGFGGSGFGGAGGSGFGGTGGSGAEGQCAPGCEPGWPGDGACDAECNVDACSFDAGDCDGGGGGGGSGGEGQCAPGCEPGWPGDGRCDAECNVDTCSFDAGDCDGGGGDDPCFDDCITVIMQCPEPAEGVCYATCSADREAFVTCVNAATSCGDVDACY